MRTFRGLTSANALTSSLPNHSGSYMSARQSCSRRDASCMAKKHKIKVNLVRGVQYQETIKLK